MCSKLTKHIVNIITSKLFIIHLISIVDIDPHPVY